MSDDIEHKGRFVLSYYKHGDETPTEESGDKRDEMIESADRIWAARERNGFETIELWDGAGEEWELLQTWPEDAIDRLYD